MMRPAIIIWAYWKEVPGIDWEDAELLDPVILEMGVPDDDHLVCPVVRLCDCLGLGALYERQAA
jgi:hypothetical protein